MPPEQSRRRFLQTAATAGAALGLGDFAALAALGPANADESKVTPDLVRFGPDMEPVVRLIEETPQDACVAVMIEQLKKGLPYRQFLGALYLAAIRAARWHGNGAHGYNHNAYVVHSAYQLALDLPAGEQLPPAFYALNSFKFMQKVYPNKKGTPELTGKLPTAEKALDELHAAMKEWNPDRAERAVVALARSRGQADVLEPLWHYAARTWSFIGHMPILVANSCRLLETIGWQHAEHILRYVVQGLSGWGQAHARHPDMLPYWANLPRVEREVERLEADWAEGKGDGQLTQELVAMLRDCKGDDACELAVKRLTDGKAKAGAVWDAIHLAAGELVLASKPFSAQEQTNGDALHANTAANALHYAFRRSTRADTRLLLTLQAMSWMPLYRNLSIKKKLLISGIDLTGLSGDEIPDRPEAAIDAILATRTATPHQAGRLAFAFVQRHQVGPLLSAARRLVVRKSSGDPHDIKFPVAIFEDLNLINPEWRPHLVAAAVFSFWGSDRPDNLNMEKVREAVRSL